MSQAVGSNSLPVLAARIREEHIGARGAIKRSVEHAMAAGDLLREAKALLKHGEWLPWLAEHCKMSERTAQLYMRVARNRPAIKANPQWIADLTLNEVAKIDPAVVQTYSILGEIEGKTDSEEIKAICIKHNLMGVFPIVSRSSTRTRSVIGEPS
jgi:Protein of unknown function (DUF3102)